MTSQKHVWCIIVLTLILGLFLPGISLSQPPVKLAILPFKIYSPKDLSYLQQGLSVMLRTRLSWEGHIEVVDIDKKALEKLKDVKKLAQEFNLDYILSGSLTMFGNSASIDLKLTNVEERKATPFFAQCPTIDEVIPKIGSLSTEIVETIIPSLEKEVARPSVIKKPKRREMAPPVVVPENVVSERGKETEIKTLFYVTFITGSLKQKKPQTYHLFLSDKPQVKGEDPIVDEEDIEEANFPEYRRAGNMERQGFDLGKVTVKKSTNFVFDVTDFINNYPSKRYFLAVKREEADYFVAMEAWFKRGAHYSSGKTKIVFQIGILGGLLDQKFHTEADTLEFDIGSPEW